MPTKKTNHDKIMDKLLDIQSSLPLMKDKIERLEDSHAATEAMIQEIHTKIHDADTGIAGDIREIKVWQSKINKALTAVGGVITAVVGWAIKCIIKGE
jgi:predicted  nucleic acid-binding Zn-ribbon protein